MPSEMGVPMISARTGQDLDEILRLYRSGALTRKPVTVRRYDDVGSAPPVRLVMLLGTLTRKTVVPALRMRDARNNTNFEVSVLGWPPLGSQDTFDLKVDGRTVPIPFRATADEFQQRTGLRDATITGGATEFAETLYSPMRWYISLSPDQRVPALVPVDPEINTWLVTVEETWDVATTSVMQVRQRLPTGWTSPLRAGALCECHEGDREWVVIGAETRQWWAPSPLPDNGTGY